MSVVEAEKQVVAPAAAVGSQLIDRAGAVVAAELISAKQVSRRIEDDSAVRFPADLSEGVFGPAGLRWRQLVDYAGVVGAIEISRTVEDQPAERS